MQNLTEQYTKLSIDGRGNKFLYCVEENLGREVSEDTGFRAYKAQDTRWGFTRLPVGCPAS